MCIRDRLIGKTKVCHIRTTSRTVNRKEPQTSRGNAVSYTHLLRTIISYEKGESYPKKRSTYDVLAEIFEIPSVELRSETDELDFQNLPEIPESMMEVIRIFNDPDLSGEEVMAQLHELWVKRTSE